MDDSLLRMEIDGRAPTDEEYRFLALNRYGHFTAMQVRDGRTRGLDLHIARLAAANREMFDVGLDGDLVCAHIRHCLGDTADASVRVLVLASADDTPCVIVTVRGPGLPPNPPHAMRSVPYQRPLPHLKQVGGGFGQGYYQRIARREGFAEALLTGPDGVISEGAVTNIGFFDGDGVVWPAAPALAGITMQLLRAHPDLESRAAAVRLDDVGSYRSVFVANARGIVPVGRIDDQVLPIDDEFTKSLDAIYESVPWERF
jgi:branched-subunit amino acid aminotransferase/4-amino-4-deoxychorismate lyase